MSFDLRSLRRSQLATNERDDGLFVGGSRASPRFGRHDDLPSLTIVAAPPVVAGCDG
jgi:hypothetical protein